MEVLSNETDVKIYINEKQINYSYNLGCTDTPDGYEEIRTISFDKKIKQAIIGRFGQAVGEEVILYVLEDGTVEYTSIYDDLKNNWNNDSIKKISSYGKIESVEKMSHIDKVNVTDFDSNGQFLSGYLTTVAIRKDG